jgi:outer membrane protein assembly factor BamB
MNESRTDDFTQLRGAFDRPIAPSPTFAEHLREQIELELSAGERVSIDHGTNAPLRLQVSTSRVQTLTANGWQGALMTAAAIALVLAMVFGALRITTDRGGDGGDDPMALPGLAATPSTIHAQPEGTPEASDATGQTSPLDAAWGGTDRSFNMGVDAPELGDTVERIGDRFQSNDFSQVVHGYAIGTENNVDDQDRPTGKVTAIDLATGEIAWTLDLLIIGGFASDGRLLFGWNAIPDSQWKMVALDLVSGEIVWSGYDPVPSSGEQWSMGPVYADGMIYFPSGSLGLVAVDAATGDVAWQHRQDSMLPETEATNDQFTQQSRTSSLVVVDGRVLVVWEGRIVESFDPKTGSSDWEWQLPVSESDTAVSALMTADNRYAFIQRFSEDGTRILLALDLVSLFVVWERDDISAVMPPALTSERVIVTLESNSVAALDKGTGETMSQFFDPVDEVRPPDISAANETIFVAYSSVVYRFDTATLDQPTQEWQLGVAPNRSTVYTINGGNPTLWNGDLYVGPEGGYLLRIPGYGATEPAAATPTKVVIVPDPTETMVEGGDNLGGNETPGIAPDPTAQSTETLVPTPSGQQEDALPTATPISGGDNLPGPTVTPADEVTSGASPAATPVTAEEFATPDVAEEENLDAGWGGAGRTWNANIEVLAPDAELLPQGFEPQGTDPGRVYQSQVFGDLLVRYIVRSSTESSGIEAIEWETGEVRWYRETEVRSGFAFDPERVFIIETKEPQLGLTALDVETGTEVWNLDVGFNFDIGESAASQSPIVSDGVVYFTDLNSKVGAADAATGELIWSSDSVVSVSDAASVPANDDPDSYTPYPAANFALDDRYVYVVRVNRIVETLDRVTGEHVRSFELTLQSHDPTDNGEDRTFKTQDVDIVATDSAIIVIESLAGDEHSGQIGESTIWALEPETGTMKWSTRDAAVTGNVTIFESVLYVSFLPGSISGFDLDSGGKVKTLDVQMGANDKVAMSSTNDHLMVYVHNEDGYTLFQYGSGHDGQADAVYSLGYADNTPIDYLPIPQYSGDELIVAAHYGTIWRLTPPWLMPIAT